MEKRTQSRNPNEATLPDELNDETAQRWRENIPKHGNKKSDYIATFWEENYI